MRSQQEILEKIRQLTSSGADPMKCQRKLLISKLRFDTAKKNNFVHVQYHNDITVKEAWNSGAKLDKKSIRHEMFDYMFHAYEFAIEQQSLHVIASVQNYIIWIWLLGHKYDKLIEDIIQMFFINSGDKDYGKPVFNLICNEMGWNIKTFYRGTEEAENEKEDIEDIRKALEIEDPKIILPGEDNFKWPK